MTNGAPKKSDQIPGYSDQTTMPTQAVPIRSQLTWNFFKLASWVSVRVRHKPVKSLADRGNFTTGALKKTSVGKCTSAYPKVTTSPESVSQVPITHVTDHNRLGNTISKTLRCWSALSKEAKSELDKPA